MTIINKSKAKFRPMTFYKHELNRDVLIQIIQLAPYADYTLMEVVWWNVVGSSPFPIGVSTLIKIDASEYDKWIQTSLEQENYNARRG